MSGHSQMSALLRRPISGRRELVSEKQMSPKPRRARVLIRDRRDSGVDPRILLAQRRWL